MNRRSDPSNSAYFATRYASVPGETWVWREICRFLQRYVPPQSIVLDLGAGHCGFINQIKAHEKHAVDDCPAAAGFAKPGIHFHLSGSSLLGMFGGSSVDVVFASNLLEHLTREELAKTLEEVRRILRTGGRLLVLQPNFRYSYKKYFDDYTHRRIFTHVSLRDLLSSSGFQVEVVQPRFLPFSMRSGPVGFPWLVRLYLRSPIKPFAGQMLLVARKGV